MKRTLKILAAGLMGLSVGVTAASAAPPGPDNHAKPAPRPAAPAARPAPAHPGSLPRDRGINGRGPVVITAGPRVFPGLIGGTVVAGGLLTPVTAIPVAPAIDAVAAAPTVVPVPVYVPQPVAAAVPADAAAGPV